MPQITNNNDSDARGCGRPGRVGGIVGEGESVAHVLGHLVVGVLNRKVDIHRELVQPSAELRAARKGHKVDVGQGHLVVEYLHKRLHHYQLGFCEDGVLRQVGEGHPQHIRVGGGGETAVGGGHLPDAEKVFARELDVLVECAEEVVHWMHISGQTMVAIHHVAHNVQAHVALILGNLRLLGWTTFTSAPHLPRADESNTR